MARSAEETATRPAGLVMISGDVTVFDDAASFTVKHPLYSKWQRAFCAVAGLDGLD